MEAKAERATAVATSTGSPRRIVSTSSVAPRHSAKASESRRPITRSGSPRNSVTNRATASSAANEPSAPVTNHAPKRADRESNDDPLKIIVTGYPQYSQPQDLARVFSKFGHVVVNKITPSYATLVFGSKDEALEAVKASKKVNVYGEFLTVKPFNDRRAAELAKNSPKRDFTRTKEKGKIIEPAEIGLSGSFGQQLQRLLAAVRLTQEEVAALGALYADVEAALQPHYAGCTAIPFGSITTGLGVKSSDADCFVLLAPQHRHYSNHVNKARRMLELHPKVFTEILSIPRANTPIVKFFHIPTGTNCDLSFKTALGAQNSKLIAYLLHSDPRLIPLAVLVKYWARVHQLSGTGKLTNYALTLLVIFYLQQPPHTILPSVLSLQHDQNYDVIVDNWNTGFAPRPITPPTDDKTLLQLIGGFFRFYTDFDYENLAVCPYLGTTIKKELFRDTNLLPSEFQRYKNNVLSDLVMPIRCNTSMCVQDPFEQCHNVASAISPNLTAELIAYFKHAADAYDAGEVDNRENFLRKILFEKPVINRNRGHPEYRVRLPRRLPPPAAADTEWRELLREIVFVIFEDMLKISLEKLEDKPQQDPRKVKERFNGAVTKPVWRRKRLARLFHGDLGFKERQAQITEEILKTDEQSLDIQFQLTMSIRADGRGATLTVRYTSGDSDRYREFGQFFMSIMQNWFTSLVRLRPSIQLQHPLEALDLDSEPEDGAVRPLVITNSAIRCGPGP